MNRSEQAEIVLGNLVSAVEMLENCPEFSSLVPEVRVNLAYALPGAKAPDEVAGVAIEIARRYRQRTQG